jgi:hypothetical protein
VFCKPGRQSSVTPGHKNGVEAYRIYFEKIGTQMTPPKMRRLYSGGASLHVFPLADQVFKRRRFDLTMVVI